MTLPKFPLHSKVRCRKYDGIFTIEQWSEAVRKYQLKLGDHIFPEWVPEDQLELVDDGASHTQPAIIVPDPIITEEPS